MFNFPHVCHTSPRCAQCSRQQRCLCAVQSPRTPCGCVCFGHAQINAAAWRLHSVLDSTLKGRFVNAVWSSLWARRVHAVKTPFIYCIWSWRLQCILIILQIIIKCIYNNKCKWKRHLCFIK